MDASRNATAVIPRPRWGVLYSVVFLGLVALAIGDVAAPETARPTLDGALAAAALVAISLWVRGNRAALDQQNWCECAADTLTVRVIPSRHPEPRQPWIPRPFEEDEEIPVVGVCQSQPVRLNRTNRKPQTAIVRPSPADSPRASPARACT